MFSNCKDLAEEKHPIVESFVPENYEDFENLGGVVLGNTDRSIGQLRMDSLNLFVLQRFVSQKKLNLEFEKLDEVQFIEHEPFLFIDSEFCNEVNGDDSDFIIAIVKDKEVAVFENSNVLKAWKINLSTDKFEEIESLNVQCINQWYGYDG
ncbi:hypothetical protein NMS_0597 [Nonlabens marinus S1-08]|uniref:Uncharacterized protein n=1 Tax=Nonlabens marinus S1-08 TaxID=1454201 RepID=W8VZH9_9FLAO|nr:hypothetical protein NMS_0597 [Nonlabens marinus S1-08]